MKHPSAPMFGDEEREGLKEDCKVKEIITFLSVIRSQKHRRFL